MLFKACLESRSVKDNCPFVLSRLIKVLSKNYSIVTTSDALVTFLIFSMRCTCTALNPEIDECLKLNGIFCIHISFDVQKR